MTTTMHLVRVLAATALLAAGCGGDDDGGGSEGEGEHHEGEGEGEHSSLEEMAEHACTHFQTGTPEAVTAGAARDETAPELEVGHAVHAVTLGDLDGQHGGWLRLVRGEAGEVVLMASKDVPLAVEDADGQPVTPEHEHGQPETCAAIHELVAVHLAVATYWVKLGPTDETEVDLLAEEAGHHEHE